MGSRLSAENKKVVFSFLAGIETKPGELRSLLGGEISGSPLYSHISHIYIENPFSLLLDDKSERQEKQKGIASVVKVIRSFGIKPVFVFDYTCMGDYHLTADYQSRIGMLMGFLNSIGVTNVSLGDLYLAEMFSSEFPPYTQFSHFDVFLSHHAKINHVVKLTYLNTFDYRMITLHPDMNRDNDEIKRAVKYIGGEKIEIVLNSPCIVRCPLETFCSALRFHLREERIDPEEMEEAASYYSKQCTRWLEEDPSIAEQIPRIAPEELAGYISAGVSHFRIINDAGNMGEVRELLECYAGEVSNGGEILPRRH